MKFTAIIQHFYKERAKYLPLTVGSIGLAEPEEIIIWDNANSLKLGAPNVTVIRSSRNTLMGRYAAVMIAKTNFIYIQDDDLVVSGETIHRLLHAAEVPYRIAGIKGVKLSQSSHHPYTDGRAAVGDSDMVLGRAFAFQRPALFPGFQYALSRSVNPGRSDDILFGMASRQAYAIENPHYTNLDEEGVGLSHEPQHYEERNQMCRQLIVDGF